MTANHGNIDFTAIDTTDGFDRYDDDNAAISQKILSGGLDRSARRGSRTRLLRLDPGARTPAAHAHAYWEEIWMLEGEMIVADSAAEGGERTVGLGYYACRQPGFIHGPVRSETGCLMIEFSWYPNETAD